MASVLGLGIALVLVGLVLLVNLFGAGDFVIGRVTSRSLGELAPGFAASSWGFRTYAALVLAVGVACVGVWMTTVSSRRGAALFAIGVALFVIASAVAVTGEVVVYRRPKR